MADHSTIEWTEATWNPIAGCSVVSPGCTNCYAMRRVAPRLAANPATPQYRGTVAPSKGGYVWTGRLHLAPERVLLKPLSWRAPRTVFVNSTSDLFHEAVPDSWIDLIFAVMALCPQHTFQVLTKRPARMRAYLSDLRTVRDVYETACDLAVEGGLPVVLIAPGMDERHAPPGRRAFLDTWPLPTVWLGTSVEDQTRADERIPELLATPAAVRFVSCEPLLGPVDLTEYLDGREAHGMVGNCIGWRPLLDWVIVGGESGPGARPMHPDWARSLRDQCTEAVVPFFFKQWGEWLDADDWYDHLSQQGWHIRKDGHLWQPPQPLNYQQAAWLAEQEGFPHEHHSDGTTLIRVGKHAAGRLLDGVLHDAMPARAP